MSSTPTGSIPMQALEAEVDVLAPCALGGILDHDTVPRLRCRIVAGAANNQLADESVADLLSSRGILWAPDFVANAGGIINIAEEQHGYDAAGARRRVRRIGEITLEIFDRADAAGITPLAAAVDLARARLQLSYRHIPISISIAVWMAAPRRRAGVPRRPACRGGRRV